MKTCEVVWLLLGLAGAMLAAEDKKELPPGVISVALAAEDTKIKCVEIGKRRLIDISAQGASVQADRVYIGDGKIAVEFYVDEDSVRLRGGVAAGSFNFRKGSIIAVDKPVLVNQLKAGDVYVLTPGIQFEYDTER